MSDKTRYLGFKALDMGFDAHLTLYFLGEIDEETTQAVKAWLFEQNLYNHKTHVARESLATFGSRRQVPVVRVNAPPAMYILREDLKQLWPNRSTYEWNPHITLKLNHHNTIHIPELITLTHFDLY